VKGALCSSLTSSHVFLSSEIVLALLLLTSLTALLEMETNGLVETASKDFSGTMKRIFAMNAKLTTVLTVLEKINASHALPDTCPEKTMRDARRRSWINLVELILSHSLQALHGKIINGPVKTVKTIITTILMRIDVYYVQLP